MLILGLKAKNFGLGLGLGLAPPGLGLGLAVAGLVNRLAINGFNDFLFFSSTRATIDTISGLNHCIAI